MEMNSQSTSLKLSELGKRIQLSPEDVALLTCYLEILGTTYQTRGLPEADPKIPPLCSDQPSQIHLWCNLSSTT